VGKEVIITLSKVFQSISSKPWGFKSFFVVKCCCLLGPKDRHNGWYQVVSDGLAREVACPMHAGQRVGSKSLVTMANEIA